MKLEYDKCFGVQEAQLPVDKTETVDRNLLNALFDKELFPDGTEVFVHMEPTNWIPGEHDETDMVAFKTTAPFNNGVIIDFFLNGDGAKYFDEISDKKCGWMLVQAYPEHKLLEIGYY